MGLWLDKRIHRERYSNVLAHNQYIHTRIHEHRHRHTHTHLHIGMVENHSQIASALFWHCVYMKIVYARIDGSCTLFLWVSSFVAVFFRSLRFQELEFRPRPLCILIITVGIPMSTKVCQNVFTSTNRKQLLWPIWLCLVFFFVWFL